MRRAAIEKILCVAFPLQSLRLRVSLFLFLALSLGSCAREPAAEVQFTVNDSVAHHVRQDDADGTISVNSADAEMLRVNYFWRDVFGAALTDPAASGENQFYIMIPADAPPYMELVFVPQDRTIQLAGRIPGEERAYGFAFFNKFSIRYDIIDLVTEFSTS